MPRGPRLLLPGAASRILQARFYLPSKLFREQSHAAKTEDEVADISRPPARLTSLRARRPGQEDGPENRAAAARVEVGGRGVAHGRLHRPRPPVRSRQR